jgi:Fibronectin type III domain
LAFRIQNKPAWAAFDSSDGALTGTPGLADVGTDANIVISVSDSKSTTSLAPFSISVNEVSNGAATLNWSGVTQPLTGTALGNLAGYIVYYGTSADNLNQQVKLENPGLTSYMVTNLASATWYFAVAAYTRDGVVGEMSGITQKTVP